MQISSIILNTTLNNLLFKQKVTSKFEQKLQKSRSYNNFD